MRRPSEISFQSRRGEVIFSLELLTMVSGEHRTRDPETRMFCAVVAISSNINLLGYWCRITRLSIC